MENQKIVRIQVAQRKPRIRQTERDDNEVARRIRSLRYGYQQFKALLEAHMGNRGQKCTKESLFGYATELVNTYGLQKPDRLCKRRIEALFCWFSSEPTALMLTGAAPVPVAPPEDDDMDAFMSFDDPSCDDDVFMEPWVDDCFALQLGGEMP